VAKYKVVKGVPIQVQITGGEVMLYKRFQAVPTIFLVILIALLWSTTVEASYWGTLSKFANNLNQDPRYSANHIAVLEDKLQNRQALIKLYPSRVLDIAKKAGSQAVELLSIEAWLKMASDGPVAYFFKGAETEIINVGRLAITLHEEGKAALVLAKLKDSGNYDLYAVVNNRQWNETAGEWIKYKGYSTIRIGRNYQAHHIPKTIRLIAGTGDSGVTYSQGKPAEKVEKPQPSPKPATEERGLGVIKASQAPKSWTVNLPQGYTRMELAIYGRGKKETNSFGGWKAWLKVNDKYAWKFVGFDKKQGGKIKNYLTGSQVWEKSGKGRWLDVTKICKPGSNKVTYYHYTGGSGIGVKMRITR
jgi:hypothetical protein